MLQKVILLRFFCPYSYHFIQSKSNPLDTLYFSDCQRRIDMILVFEDDLDFLKEQRRKTYLRSLVEEGVEIEIEHPDPTKRRVICYHICYGNHKTNSL